MITLMGSFWRQMTQSVARACLVITISNFSFLIPHSSSAQTLTMVELNCENLFDYLHDEGKDDKEYLPEATRHWTKKRYWRKVNNIAQEILSCSDEGIPDLIALCEIENDSVVRDLTKRSLLRNAGYEYLTTTSPDLRGIDVALLYSPFSFAPIRNYGIRVSLLRGCAPRVISFMSVEKRLQAIRFMSLWSICPVVSEGSIIVSPFVRQQHRGFASR